MSLKSPLIRRLLTRLLLTAALCLPLHAGAQIAVKTAEAIPDANVLLKVEDTNPGDRTWRWFRNSDKSVKGRRDVGQVFSIADDAKWGALVLQVGQAQIGQAAPGAPFTLSIYEYTDAAGIDPSKAVSTQKGQLPAAFAEGQYLVLELDPVSLQAKKRYAFVLTFDEAAPRRFFNLVTVSDRNYRDGTGLFFGENKANTEDVAGFFETRGNLAFTLLAPQD